MISCVDYAYQHSLTYYQSNDSNRQRSAAFMPLDRQFAPRHVVWTAPVCRNRQTAQVQKPTVSTDDF